MADLQPISRAFPNGGLQLKQDPALLDESHYSELTNVVSVQEGNITVRAGSQKLTRADEWQQDFDEAPVIHSISALHVGDLGEEILYVGEDVNIWSRINGGDWNEIATGVAPSVRCGWILVCRWSRPAKIKSRSSASRWAHASKGVRVCRT